MKKFNYLLIIVVVVTISVSCSKDDSAATEDNFQELLIGKWESNNGSGEYLTFNSDGRGLRKIVSLYNNQVSSNEWVFSWATSNNTLTFNFVSEIKLYTYEVSKIQLILDAPNLGEPKVYIRKITD